MCILYCCEGRKLDNSLGYYITFVKKRMLYCTVLSLGDTVQNLESPGLSGRVDSPMVGMFLSLTY